MNFTTFDKNNNFSMPMSYYEGSEINNKLAFGNRFCFILIENGTGILRINDKNIPFIAPVIFCINENEEVSIDSSSNLKIRSIYFHPSIINNTLNFDNIRNTPDDFPISAIQDSYMVKYFIKRENGFYGKINIGPLSNKRFEGLCESFKTESINQNRENWPCRSRSYIMEILFLLENIYLENDISKDNVLGQVDDELYSILLYIINNYDKKITIPSLTKKFNINRTTLSEKFTNVVGESIISYVNKLRINMASIILRDTKLPVSEVMERVGFSDNTHFLRTFKKYMGISPREYRDKYCWM
jgi:AraC family L-rhamnose operon regulatory protein RhaS